MQERVAVYIDGFNLYHAIKAIDKPHLKWLDVYKLSQLLIKRRSQRLISVKYFSAYANHYSGTEKVHRLVRHRSYVKALEAKGVEAYLGNFAKRDAHFIAPRYRSRWTRYEEKQTDVGIAVHLINDAHLNAFDRALVISLDTDMLPVFRLMRHHFPEKATVCVAPPRRAHHREIQNCGVELDKIRESQLEKALLGGVVTKAGIVVARRPLAYKPPAP
jgi:uncharacterized LabA/DUF88 family protein